jgi:hypothetical protein
MLKQMQPVILKTNLMSFEAAGFSKTESFAFLNSKPWQQNY